MQCRNCGQTLSPERSALGYDYCTLPACVDSCLQPVEVVALGVNKAADQYLLRRHLDLPEPDVRTGHTDDDSLGALNLGGHRPGRRPRVRGTAARIARLESELDAALATETDPDRRRKLVNDHNATLRRLNIRYRRSAQRRA